MKKVLSFEEFMYFYVDYGYCLNDIERKKKTYNDKQLNSKYEKYLRQEQKKEEKFLLKLKKSKEELKEIKKDEKWEEVKEKVLLRDGYSCQLVNKLSPLEYSELRSNSFYLLEIIDPAHIFSRGVHPELKYDIDNIVALNRFSHSNLDQQRDPITGEQICKEEQKNWWKRIISKERYNRLLQKLNNKENL